MKRHDRDDHDDVRGSGALLRTRLHALLFTGAAFGTTLLMLGASGGHKLPLGAGE